MDEKPKISIPSFEKQESEHKKKMTEVGDNYVVLYNNSALKNGAAVAFSNLRDIRNEYRQIFEKYQTEISSKIKRFKLTFDILYKKSPKEERMEIQIASEKINHLYRFGMMGINRVQYEKSYLDNFLNHARLNNYSEFKKEVYACINLIERFSKIGLHEMILNRLINFIQSNNYPSKLPGDVSNKLEGAKFDEIVNNAVKLLRRGNRKRAKKFMKLYHQAKNDNPDFNPTDFVKEIGWTDPSSNTQKDWMDKFDEAEKLFSNSD